MAEWYVRPNINHSVTRNGSAYATAWGGWSEIVWGGAGVKAGDTLFICGAHTIASTIQMGAHGATVSGRVTLSGGYAPDPGSMTVTAIGGVFFFVHRSYTTIKKLIITGNKGNCFYLYPTTGVTFQECTLYGGANAAAIIGVSAADGQIYNDLTVTDCAFIGGSGSPLGGAISWTVAASGAPVSNLNRVTIHNNTFTGNSAGRAVVQLRLEDGANALAGMTDIVITDNVFRNCTTLGMEIVGPSETGHPDYYGRNSGIRITGNKFYDMTETSAAFNLGGAMGIGGFKYSLTPGFGANIISHNEAYRITGPSGFLNTFYGTFIVHSNYAEDIIASQADGNAILIDHGCDGCIIYGNRFKRVIGHASADNSGCGIMVLNATNTTMYGNLVDGCKIGVYIGNKATGQSCLVHNNVFLNCSHSGVYALSTYDPATNLLRNNLFTGTSAAVPSVRILGGVAWTGDANNAYHSFGAPSGHTLSATSKTEDPKVGSDGRPLVGSPLIGAGVYLGGRGVDYKTFQNPPCIGAFEYVRPRSSRA